MNWIKLDIMKSETEPPTHDLVWTCYEDKNGVKRYGVGRYVSNDFPHYYENIWWANIEEPKN